MGGLRRWTILISATLCLACGVLAKESSAYYGRLIGSLVSQYHDIKGDIYAVDARTLFIKGFNYDGKAKDAVFFGGSSSKPSPDGFVIPVESGTANGLVRAYDNEDVTLTLPEGRTLKDLRWFTVWSRPYSAVVSEIKIPVGFEYPRPQRLGSLLGEHKVSSDRIYIVDAQTFLIPNFTYDGAAPDAFFWVGKGQKPGKDGFKVPDENGGLEPLRRYESKTLVLTLPADLTVFDIDWIGVWCQEFYVDFGHVRVPKNLNVPPSLKMLGVAPQAKLNCEVLWDELALEVRWAVAGETIVLQLVGKLEDRQYISFGPSGDLKRSRMTGGDVAVGWLDRVTGKGYVNDYFMSYKGQCAGGQGVCADSTLPGGSNNIRVLNAALVNEYVMLTYQRPLKATDEHDRPIITNGTQAVVWAIGPLDSNNQPSYHTLHNRGDILLDFGRTPQWNCPDPEELPAAGNSKPTELVPYDYSDLQQQYQPKTPVSTPQQPLKSVRPWYIPPIECYEPENRVFYAHIGPNGGKQGYNAITNHVGWGITWYINGLLIPEVTVVRGQTYTFVVEGGQDPDRPARYHPFYITDDPEGGYEFKTPAERANVKVFAGVGYDREGNPKPTAAGRLCEWMEDPAYPADSFTSFGGYQRTLKLNCEEGQPAILQWTPDEDTPDTVYYQCYTHRYLGWKIRVIDSCNGAKNRKYLESSPSDYDTNESSSIPVRGSIEFRAGQDYESEYYDEEYPNEAKRQESVQKQQRDPPGGQGFFPYNDFPKFDDFFKDSAFGKEGNQPKVPETSPKTSPNFPSNQNYPSQPSYQQPKAPETSLKISPNFPSNQNYPSQPTYQKPNVPETSLKTSPNFPSNQNYPVTQTSSNSNEDFPTFFQQGQTNQVPTQTVQKRPVQSNTQNSDPYSGNFRQSNRNQNQIQKQQHNQWEEVKQKPAQNNNFQPDLSGYVSSPSSNLRLAQNTGFNPDSIIWETGFKPIKSSSGPIPPLGFEVEPEASEPKTTLNSPVPEYSLKPTPNFVTLDPLFVPSELEGLNISAFDNQLAVPLPVPVVPVVPGPPSVKQNLPQRPKQQQQQPQQQQRPQFQRNPPPQRPQRPPQVSVPSPPAPDTQQQQQQPGSKIPGFSFFKFMTSQRRKQQQQPLGPQPGKQPHPSQFHIRQQQVQAGGRPQQQREGQGRPQQNQDRPGTINGRPELFPGQGQGQGQGRPDQNQDRPGTINGRPESLPGQGQDQGRPQQNQVKPGTINGRPELFPDQGQSQGQGQGRPVQNQDRPGTINGRPELFSGQGQGQGRPVQNQPIQQQQNQAGRPAKQPSFFSLQGISRIIGLDRRTQKVSENSEAPAPTPAKQPARGPPNQKPKFPPKQALPPRTPNRQNAGSFQGKFPPVPGKPLPKPQGKIQQAAASKLAKSSIPLDPISASIINGGSILGMAPGAVKSTITAEERAQLEDLLFGPSEQVSKSVKRMGYLNEEEEEARDSNIEYADEEGDFHETPRTGSIEQDGLVFAESPSVGFQASKEVSNETNVVILTDVWSNMKSEAEKKTEELPESHEFRLVDRMERKLSRKKRLANKTNTQSFTEEQKSKQSKRQTTETTDNARSLSARVF